MAQNRILIVKTSSLGDVIHHLPVIADIHAQSPGLIIDWAVEEGFSDIPAMHPGVSSVIPVSLRRWRKNIASSQTWQEIAACKKRLSEHTYDVVLDSQGLLKSALVASWARGSRHGYAWGSAREPLASLFYQHKHMVGRAQHAVVRNRQLAALALGYENPKNLPDYGIRATASNLAQTLPSDYMVGLHATSRDSKLWPIECWVELGRHLSAQGMTLLLPWGSEQERARATVIQSQIPLAQVLPKLSLSELAAILANATVCIGVDTGLIHLAAALNAATVAIYTDTNPALTGVLGMDGGRVLNLGGIGRTPSCDDVVAALNRLVPA